MGQHIVAWNNLKCAFDGRVVFEGFSGSLDAGERVRVAGPSGCGKTSFLSMVLGFLKPAEGTISYSDDIIGGASPVAAVEYQWLLLTAIFAAKSISIALALELAIMRTLCGNLWRENFVA